MSPAEQYMKRALELARSAEGRTAPNPAVGAVIVRDGKVVGEGFHPEAGAPHAEIFALRQAGDLARGAEIYVTLEPCSHQGRTGPCADALVKAGIGRVIVGTLDPNPVVSGRGVSRIREAGIEVETGICESECRRLIAPFAKHVVSGLPHLTLKSAVTLDGKTATSTGHSQWISNADCRQEVHRLRDRVDGIMVGIGTVLKDDPKLTTRLPEGGRDPLRIVVDSRLRIPEQALVLSPEDSQAPTIVATLKGADPEKAARLAARGVELWEIPDRGGRVDLEVLMKRLGERGLQSVLLEGGSGLNAAALSARLVDRVMIFVAPKIVGGSDGYGIFGGRGVLSLSDAVTLEEVRFTPFGDNILIEGECTYVHRPD